VLVFKDDPIASGRSRLLRDGRSFLFVANRPGGHGASDIWMAELVKKKDQSEATTSNDNASSAE
ncbi:MAG: hypothetical protein KDA70_17440, partial [Planctomycetaceae bacterium]|nr:hypothetical protein [Planctomycetaceae bacterium]